MVSSMSRMMRLLKISVQDAFLKVWEKRADFYFVAAIKSFLYMSVRNACLDYLRHQKVQRRNEPELILWLTEEGGGRIYS